MPFASRLLTYRASETSEDINVSIIFDSPEKRTEREWCCRYEIGWPDGREVEMAYGIDSVQALYVAMQIVGAKLYTSDHHKSGKLRFEETGRGYGFPVASTLRDLLVGDDLMHC